MDKATWEIFLEGLYCNALGFEIHGAVHLQDIAAELCLDLLLKHVFGGQVGAEYQGPPFGAQGSSLLNSNRQVRCRLPSLPGPGSSGARFQIVPQKLLSTTGRVH